MRKAGNTSMRRLSVLFVALLCAFALIGPSVVPAIAEPAEEEPAGQTEEASTEGEGTAGEETKGEADATSEKAGESSTGDEAAEVTEDEEAELPRTVETETTIAEDESKPNLAEARAACVMDDYGNVLYELNGEVEMDMASITKVMTAMVALDSGVDLDKEFSFVVDDYNEDAQIAGFQDGQSVTLRDLLLVSLIYSGNDAATNVAYAVSGSKEAFVKQMNEKAAQIGMEHTKFANPHGLKEKGHHSCALDLCKMGRYALEHYPFIRNAVRTRSIDVMLGEALITLYSTDDLMEYYDPLRGIKTGTEATGHSFLGSARRDQVTLYSCVLCCDSGQGRFDDTETLLEWGFSLYDQRALANTAWVVRSVAWRDGFWLRCPVSPTRTMSGGQFRGKGIDYKVVTLKPNAMTGGQSAYGSTVWSQEGRTLGSTSYRTGQPTSQMPAWNAFVAPLFGDEA